MPLERAKRSVALLRDVIAGKRRVDARPLDVGALARAGSSLDGATALALFESQVAARLCDVEAHALRARGQGFYTICSAGHEGNVVLGKLLRTTDPALLHYRSAALFLERCRHDARVDGVLELMLSLAASADDPISGGRHKVFGSVPLGIPPQTSTIASHLPKAVGLAVALARAARLRLPRRPHASTEGPWTGHTPDVPPDTVVLCSFGDASLNHSTAQGAINAASWAAFQRLPVPVLLVCEDNTLGVSVRTPERWVEARMRAMPAVSYVHADGCDLAAAWTGAEEAVRLCRERRGPVFLHLTTERLWGHAGSDLDSEYRSADEVAAAEARDPVARAAQSLLDGGVATTAALSAMVERQQARVAAASAEAVRRPKLTTRAQVMETIAPSRPAEVAAEARRSGYAPMPKDAAAPKPLGLCIRAGLGDLLRKYAEATIFGEDVAQKGGVYGVTVGLWKTFGPSRVFNTLLDEQTILGLAIGAGQAGLLPIPEIQFLAYLHNAEDQLRGEAATLSFFSSGRMKNPMVVRIAGLGYQKGFGGHFHNDDSLAVLRDLPGVVVAVPSRGDDAVKMLRTLCAAARVDGRVGVFVEPIALYHTRDLFPGDGRWCFPVPPQDEAIAVGEVGVYEPAASGGARVPLVVLTYGNGVPMSLRAQKALGDGGVAVRVVDLRWIAPLPTEAIAAHAADADAVLVVDECRKSGNVSEAIATVLAEDAALRGKPFARVTSADSFIPLADAANLVLAQEAEIVEAARALVGRR